MEIKIDQSTMPRDGAKVKWINHEGVMRTGTFIKEENMFFVGNGPIYSSFDSAFCVISWEYL